MLRSPVFLSLVLLGSVLCTFGAEKPFVRVRWNDGTLRITYKENTSSYKLEMGAIDKVKTEYLEKKNGVVYMLLDIGGPSLGWVEGSSSSCGAGWEQEKALLTFNEKGEVKPPVFVEYESCLYGIDESPVINNFDDGGPANAPEGELLTRFNHYDGESNKLVTTRAYFDHEHPEKGITLLERCAIWDSGENTPCPK